MTEGAPKRSWGDHFDAMERWKNRAIEAAHGDVSYESGGFEISSLEAIDFGGAFFVWAHSMRDWLINSKVIEQNVLDAALNLQDDWLMVRDLANKTKHQFITRNPTDSKWISGVKIDLNALLRGKHGVEPYILFNGQYIRLADCIGSIWEMWNTVMLELEIKKDEQSEYDRG